MSEALVIPCYNEEKRLPISEIELLLQDSQLHLLFVDDGSSDGTREILEGLAKRQARISISIQSANRGKAEAVRLGLLQMLADGHTCIGYADADFATPARELLRLLAVFREKRPQVLLGSRVRLLGHEIERKTMRHILGRVFATIASAALQLPVYDTQCGAKFFQVTDGFSKAVSTPFTSRWAFDVELLARICGPPSSLVRKQIIEVPLQKWADIKGSKLTLSAMFKAGIDLIVIGFRLRRADR